MKISRKRSIKLLNTVIEHLLVAEKVTNVIEQLFNLGFKSSELEALGFSKSDINDVRYSTELYEMIEVCGQPMLFAKERLYNSDIPNGLFVYHLRGHTDNNHSKFTSLEPAVLIDHKGSVISKTPIDFMGKSCIAFSDEKDEPSFFGNELTMQEFVDMDFEN